MSVWRSTRRISMPRSRDFFEAPRPRARGFTANLRSSAVLGAVTAVVLLLFLGGEYIQRYARYKIARREAPVSEEVAWAFPQPETVSAAEPCMHSIARPT